MTHETMLLLVNSFPTLRDTPLREWDPEVLDNWACGSEPSEAAVFAAQFVLSVWNPTTEWKCGAFSVSVAMGIWDDKHRAAFLEWAQRPWWP